MEPLSTYGKLQLSTYAIQNAQANVDLYAEQASSGKKAKRFGAEAERKFVWWCGEEIPYGSQEHRDLIERAIRAKFEQNKEAVNV